LEPGPKSAPNDDQTGSHIYNPKPQSASPATSATGTIWPMLTAAAPPVNCADFVVVAVALAVLLAARVVVTATGVVEAALVLALAELVLRVLLAATEEGVEGLMVMELAETAGAELDLTALLLLRVTGTADETEACVEEESLSVLVLRELAELA
jgi:hypothetical protein